MADSDEKIAMGAEARRVWDSALVQGFMHSYVNALFVQWVNSRDAAERETLWAKAKVAEDFKATFQNAMASGRAEQKKRDGETGGDGPVPPII